MATSTTDREILHELRLIARSLSQISASLQKFTRQVYIVQGIGPPKKETAETAETEKGDAEAEATTTT